MTKGTYEGFTIGIPTTIGGFGGGLYFDHHGNLYPQLYYGMPGAGVSAGYSPDLEGLLTGTSVSGSFGHRPIRTSVGASHGSTGIGLGTPGFGVTYGFGPYPLVPPAMGPQDELTPFQRSLQSGNGSLGANTTPAVPFLGQRNQNPLGGRMGGWSASATHQSAGNAPPASPSPNEAVNDRFGSWSSSANAAPQDTPGSQASFNDRFGNWGSAPADSFGGSSSPVLRYLDKYRRSALPGWPGPLPSDQASSLPATLSGPIAPGGGNVAFDDTFGLPTWMRSALAYQPENESTNTASAEDNANAASDDRKNIRRLSTLFMY